MKYIATAIILGLLVGCSSTKSINGKYDLDTEYTARETANSIKHEGLAASKEEIIQQVTENLKGAQFKAEIDFPYLRVTTINPAKTTVYNLEQLDKTHYTAIKPDQSENIINYTYDPIENSLSSVTTRFIKR